MFVNDSPELTAEIVRSLFSLRGDGVLIWNHRPDKSERVNAKCVGKVAGSISQFGYCRVTINDKRYAAHRIVWLHYYGRWPNNAVDHINGKRADNGIDNLREASMAENHQNKGLQKNNECGTTGVYYDKRRNKWSSRIYLNYKRIWLGHFDDKCSAYAAYLEAKKRLHKFNPVPRQHVDFISAARGETK